MYLTESKLEDILKLVYPNKDFIRDKTVPNSNIRNRPDYRNDELKIIVEFDGHTHYTQSKTILADFKKDSIYSSMGYSIIRIPYFVQMSTEIISLLFQTTLEFEQSYPHGFIDKKCILPADFCSLGLIRFEKDIERFSIIESDIKNSLKSKVKVLGDNRLVFSQSSSKIS